MLLKKKGCKEGVKQSHFATFLRNELAKTSITNVELAQLEWLLSASEFKQPVANGRGTTITNTHNNTDIEQHTTD